MSSIAGNACHKTTTDQNWTAESDAIQTWSPVVDIYESDKEIVVKAEVPGIKKERSSG